jgi:hypothetical protein
VRSGSLEVSFEPAPEGFVQNDALHPGALARPAQQGFVGMEGRVLEQGSLHLRRTRPSPAPSGGSERGALLTPSAAGRADPVPQMVDSLNNLAQPAGSPAVRLDGRRLRHPREPRLVQFGLTVALTQKQRHRPGVLSVRQGAVGTWRLSASSGHAPTCRLGRIVRLLGQSHDRPPGRHRDSLSML